MGSKFLINYVRQKWWYIQCLFAAPRLGCDVCSGVKLHTQPSCGLVYYHQEEKKKTSVHTDSEAWQYILTTRIWAPAQFCDE